MKHFWKDQRGVTLMELLVVVAIIGIMVGISLPNIPFLIAGHRLRTANNDLTSKLRYIRGLAITKNRTLQVTIDPVNETLLVEKLEHREYNLLDEWSKNDNKDFLDAVAESSATSIKNDPKVQQYVIFTEKAEKLHLTPYWDRATKAPIYPIPINYDITSVAAAKKNGIGSMAVYQEDGKTTASPVITFYPDGTLQPNLVISLKGDSVYLGEYRIYLYKAGQITSK